jgi:hypothetical protein
MLSTIVDGATLQHCGQVHNRGDRRAADPAFDISGFQ